MSPTSKYSFSVLTKVLAERNIRVIQQGMTARVMYDENNVPVALYIPSLSEDAPEGLVQAIHGFIDHEVGHILHTDAGPISAANQSFRGFDRRYGPALINILEDIRIERAQEERFRGSRYNFRFTWRFVIDKLIAPKLSEVQSPADMLNLTLPSIFRAWAGQTPFCEFLDEHHIFDIVKKFTDSVPEVLQTAVLQCRSTQEVVDLAKEILKVADWDVSPEESTQQQQVDDQESPQDPGEQSSCSGSESEEQPPSPTDEDASNDKDDESSGEESGEGEADNGGSEPLEEESDESEANGIDDEESDSPDEEQEGDPGESETGQAESGEEGSPSDAEEGDWEPSDSFDFNKNLADLINELAKEAAFDTDYYVHSREKDFIGVWSHSSKINEALVEDLFVSVDGILGPMAKSLERIIKTNSLARWSSGHRHGRFDPRVVSRLAMVNRHPELDTDRIYRCKEVSITTDNTVTILVDCSYSMVRNGIHQIALYSAYGIAKTLERIGVACEVIGFTDQFDEDYSHELADLENQLGLEFARYSALYMPIFKQHHERMTSKVTERFAAYVKYGNYECTVLGEAVDVCYERIIHQKEKGKLIMVLTDGEPFGPRGGDPNKVAPFFFNHAKKVIEKVEASPVKIVGMGIRYDVSKLFRKSVLINQISDIPSVLINELSGFMLHTR